MGSIVGAATFPLAVWIIEHPPAAVLLASLAGSAFIIYRHKGNMARLRSGTENVFHFGARSK
jgi:glycerol-3-phosphate acyltransferase PlsY